MLDDEFIINVTGRVVSVPVIYTLGGRNSLSSTWAKIIEYCLREFDETSRAVQTIRVDAKAVCGYDTPISNPADLVVAFKDGQLSEIPRFIYCNHVTENIFEITLNPILRDYFRKLKAYSCNHDIVSMMSFSTKYAALLYELLTEEYLLKRRSRICISRDKLLGMLRCDESYYYNITNFKKTILDYALRDINEYSGYDVSYICKISCKVVSDFVFSIKKKPIKKNRP